MYTHCLSTCVARGDVLQHHTHMNHTHTSLITPTVPYRLHRRAHQHYEQKRERQKEKEREKKKAYVIPPTYHTNTNTRTYLLYFFSSGGGNGLSSLHFGPPGFSRRVVSPPNGSALLLMTLPGFLLTPFLKSLTSLTADSGSRSS